MPAAEPPAEPAPTPVLDRSRLVLVADPSEERGKQCAEAVASWGLLPHLVHDGVEAMLAIQRMLPRVVVLDAALPKMYGFQVCEVIKRNESLRETKVVLVGAIHHQDRYRREPADLYGADVYLEQPDLPEALLPLVREAGLAVGGEASEAAGPAAADEQPMAFEAAASRPEPEPKLRLEPAIAPEPVAEPRAEPVPPIELEQPLERPTENAPAPSMQSGEDPLAEERERAARLARIAVSEMLLYQPEKFDQAARNGNLEEVLDLEIQEARALLRQRIGEEVRAERDFVLEELERVAAERSGQG